MSAGGARAAEEMLTPATSLRADDVEQMVRRHVSSPPRGLRRRLMIARQRFLHVRVRAETRLLTEIEQRTGRRDVRCSVCGWRGLRFRTVEGAGYLVRGARCPACESAARHRLFVAVLQRLTVDARACIYFAPEKSLLPLVQDRTRRLVTVDIDRRDVDVNVDAERLPFRDRTADLVVCNDVLEHVADDRRALREVARVLSDRGVGLLHVPVLIDRTVDYGFANEGDHGHRRVYGPDVLDRVRAAGLEVDVVGATQFSPAQRRERGLVDADAVLLVRRASS